jgi:hypothetical protein
MPPNLSAHYLYRSGATVVRQAIEPARASVSSGGHSSSYWCQHRGATPETITNKTGFCTPVGETLLGRHRDQLFCPLTQGCVVANERKQPGADR